MADDTEARAGYVYVRPKGPHREPFGWTVQINEGVMVDVGVNGHVLGVERIGGPVDFEALYQVLTDDRVLVVSRRG